MLAVYPLYILTSTFKLKPEDGLCKFVRTQTIPNSEYSLRIFDTAGENGHELGIDFIRTSTGKPVNAPDNYEIWALPNDETPWAVMPKHRINSLETRFGVKRKDLRPGVEKFVVYEGMLCLLKRPRHKDVIIKIPIRPRKKSSPSYPSHLAVISFDN